MLKMSFCKKNGDICKKKGDICKNNGDICKNNGDIIFVNKTVTKKTICFWLRGILKDPAF